MPRDLIAMILRFLRKRKNMKRIMWALAILIIPAFVIWGAGSSGKSKRKGPDHAGKIFDKKISFEEYVDMWRVTRDNLTRSFGANIPLEFIDQMTWNRIILLEAAKREGIRIHTSLAPQRFTAKHGGDGSRGIVIEFKRVASTQVDAEGRISWTLVEGAGADYTMEADSVIVAIGQIPDPSCTDGSRVKVSRRGTFVVDSATLATNVPGVFAAGDAVTPRGTVTEAIAMGREAASSIHRYLQGQDLKKNRTAPAKETLKIDPEMTSQWLTRKARWGMPSLSANDAVRTFSEADLGYTEAEAIEEAKRCLNCRMCVNCIYGRSQICFETGSRLLK